MKPADPRAVVPSTTGRDALIAVLGGALILAFIAYGFVQFSGQAARAKANKLTGVVIEKRFTPAPEQQITFGRKGLNAKQSDGEYLLKVRVEKEGGREFEVPVEKAVYEVKKVGDSLTFLRGAS